MSYFKTSGSQQLVGFICQYCLSQTLETRNNSHLHSSLRMENTKDHDLQDCGLLISKCRAEQTLHLLLIRVTRHDFFQIERTLPMQFKKPPISTMNLPPGFRTFLTLVKTPTGSRLHQCKAALLKAASNLP
jgi:hypothetical protein